MHVSKSLTEANTSASEQLTWSRSVGFFFFAIQIHMFLDLEKRNTSKGHNLQKGSNYHRKMFMPPKSSAT